MPSSSTLPTRCCIAGGGPAGMMLGLLLARAGVGVTVLEKHSDFFRDFRGDTVHPSTLQVMDDLGLLEDFLARPHDKAREIKVRFRDGEAVLADFSRLRTRCGFIAMVPQWEFLDFLRVQAQRYPTFRLLMNAQATGVIEQGGRVSGVRVSTPEGELELPADLVVAADGRHSTLRDAAGLRVRNLGAPMDALWMRISRGPGDPVGSGGAVGAGRLLATIDRGSYWQCAYIIPKGGFDALRGRGLAAFHADVASLAPHFAPRLAQEVADWEQVKLLVVTVDRLEQWWRPGLLCIGDAAHAMSPIGGLGINLAVQDAVAAANLLAAPLADAKLPADAITPWLARVQARRLWPTRVTQAGQVAAQNRIIDPLLDATEAPAMPLPVRVINAVPALQSMLAYAIGVGARPERVRSPVG
ncbi:MAG TPA: FAD-dependent oxidoreductase [Ramlibacter sp.]|nr:FAD-dependent oxidoreductase [Ramlibacter sp.]